MIKVNQEIYDAAQDALSAGRWRVDPDRGVLERSADRLAGSVNSTGYLRLRFMLNGKSVGALAHRVVWESLHGPIPIGLYVNHIDGDKMNNAVVNLELVTHAANMDHAYATGLKDGVGTAGVKNWSAKLDEGKVREIRTRCQAGELHRIVASDFGVTRAVISNIAARRLWKHVA